MVEFIEATNRLLGKPALAKVRRACLFLLLSITDLSPHSVRGRRDPSRPTPRRRAGPIRPHALLLADRAARRRALVDPDRASPSMGGHKQRFRDGQATTPRLRAGLVARSLLDPLRLSTSAVRPCSHLLTIAFTPSPTHRRWITFVVSHQYFCVVPPFIRASSSVASIRQFPRLVTSMSFLLQWFLLF